MSHPIFRKSDLNYLNTVRSIIEKDYPYKLKISDLARKAGVSESKLQHDFPMCFGKTISEFLLQIRMENAIRLLQDSDYTLKRIALEVGYSNRGSFIKIFRRAYNVTPLQYRLSFLEKKVTSDDSDLNINPDK